MKNSTRIAGFLFIALSLIDVVPLCFGVESIHPCVKPVLILSLLAAALLALLPEHKGRQTVLLAVGMLFHAAGDILLIFDSKDFAFFAAGLGAFLLGHFCYIAVLLYRMGGLRGWYEIFTWVVPMLMVFPIVSFFEVEGVLRIVLAVYTLTLLYVAACGVLWRLRGRKLGWRALAGALFFIVSDALLAINVFNGVDFPLRHAAVMGTYLLAEWLLVSAMVRQRFFD